MSLEIVTACPVCDSTSFQDYIKATDHGVTGETFSITQCTNCTLLLTNPRPDKHSISRYYESPTYISHTGSSGNWFDRIYRLVRAITVRKKVNLLQTFSHTGTVLDYGCGTGGFLSACKVAGWKTIGVEPSAAARKNIDPSIIVYESLQDVTDKPDVVTLWHVLEHVHDLNVTLSRLQSQLKKGGIIFIAVPNPESYDAKYYTNDWAGFDVPRHLWHFSKRNMQMLLTNNHFRLLEVRPMPLDSYYVSLLSEKFRNPKSHTIIRALRALMTGAKSNQRAKPDNFSSLLYIASS